MTKEIAPTHKMIRLSMDAHSNLVKLRDLLETTAERATGRPAAFTLEAAVAIAIRETLDREQMAAEPE